MKKKPLFFYFMFLIIYLELIYKRYILHNILSLNTLRIIVFSMSFVFLFTILSKLFNDRINRIISIIWSFSLTIIYASQLIYYKFYDSIYSIYSVKAGTGQVFGDFFSAILRMIFNNIWIMLAMLIPFTLFIIFGKKIFNFNKGKVNLITNVICIIGFSIISFVMVNINNKGMYSLNRLYKETHAPMITVNKVGLLSMEFLDIKRYLFGFEEKLYLENIAKEEKEIKNKVKYNILNIDFDKLISEESDETVISMHNYFKSALPSKQNEYTGMFKGKSLIYITAEGFDTIAVDENLTPTLYKLVNNGFVFENYYQPLYSVSTSDGEYMYMNSLLPKEGVWSFYRSSNIYLPYAIGKMFKNAGYETVNAYHDHTYSYYDRDKSHPNLGFDKYVGCGNGLEKLMDCKIWPESDVEMVDTTINDYINSKSFMTYYMTVSGHLNYSFNDNMMAYKNKDFVKDLPYSNNVKAYIASNIELDRALEKLINYLTEADKLKDTVIVLSPDHYPYGLKDNELNEVSKTDRSDKFEKFHTSLIIYNSEIEKPIKVSKYVSSIDVLPTVYNLFGIEYDSRLLMGRDALSDSEGFVMLSDRSWINENGKYNSMTEEFIKFNDNLSEEYVDSINNEVYQKFTMSSLLLQEKNGKFLDYYRKLGI